LAIQPTTRKEVMLLTRDVATYAQLVVVEKAHDGGEVKVIA
jgi:hypothetical protein